MTRECKQQFTLRITQANKTELIVILYEMILSYLEDAENALAEEKITEFRDALRKVRGCIGELVASLNLDYEPAPTLLSLYLYCNRELTKADIRKEKEPMDHIKMVIGKLLTAYRELAKQDDSAPVMQNSQTVYAGLTYGKNSLSENMADQGANRGFRA
ncbi:MAG: flagellar protein FliS [Lachnospiraceae bacterium]|nr:flagellar protein FliS [Lachnospiraceae bacterium]MBQ7782025.1 flagellar protein FliS [Lachnospiraceae bacterium]